MSTISKMDPKRAEATPEQIKELASFLKDGVNNVVESGVKGIDPILAVLLYDPVKGTDQVNIHMMDTGFNTPLEKKLSMKTVAAVVYKTKLFPVAVGMTSEAWVLMAKGEEEWKEHREKYLMVSDNPARQEAAIIAVQGFHRQKGQPPLGTHTMRLIKRGKNNEVGWDGDWDKEDGGTVESALMDHFFRAFLDFATRKEYPEAYLNGKKVVQLNR